MSSFFTELKRRNVFRVGIAYVVIAWLIAQVADLVFDNVSAPDWIMPVLLFLLAVGFVVAIFFAWAFELTPEGIKKEKEVDRSQSITQHTGRKLDFVIIGILVVALGYFAFDKFVLTPRIDTEVVAADAVDPDPAAEEVVAEPDRSIAVLPFADMSPDKDQEYFSDGISEEILNSLARVKELKVAGRTSSFSFKGRNDDLRTIGDALGVAHILEGSIRKSGNTLRITAQLIKVDDGFHLWSETYDRELTDVFAIQDEIAGAILEQMKLQLIGGEEPVQLASTRGDIEAYNLYLAAKQNIYKRTKTAIELADTLLERAISIDPDYAPAYAQRGIATLLLTEKNYGDIPEQEAFELARPLLDRSIELDPKLAEGYAGLGLYYQDNDNQLEKAIEMLEKALTINPGMINALNWLQNAVAQQGDMKRASQISEQILQRDPLYRPAINNVGLQYVRTGELDKQKALIERVNLYMPGDPMIRRIEIAYARDSGDLARADQLAEQAWLEAVEQGENDRSERFQYSITLAQTAQWERLSEVGLPGFRFWALVTLGRLEEAAILANQRVEEEEDYSSMLGLLFTRGQFQEYVALVESRWPDLDDYEAEEAPRIGFGAEDLLDLAYAYQQVKNREKFSEVMNRARESLEQQLANGANNFRITMDLCYEALLQNDQDKALGFIERAHELGYYAVNRESEFSPVFAALDGIPRYEELLQDMLGHVNSERAKLDLEPLQAETYL